MGLFGPPKKSTRPTSANGFAKTGGAGNMSWYRPEVEAAAAASSARRPTSASQRNGMYQQESMNGSARPVSAYNSTRYAPTQQLSARTLAEIPTAVEHEEDCICSVCNCGKHACPPTPRMTRYDPNMLSESRAAYNGRFIPAVRASAPDKYKPHDAVFEGVTTHQADFQNYGPIQPRRAPSKTAMMDTGVGRSSAPFDDTTTHKSDFPAHPIAKRNSANPYGATLSTRGPDDRDFSTEGRNAYIPHPLQPRQSRPTEQLRPSIPFQGQSTAKANFPHHVGARPSIPKFRSGGYQPNPEDRDFDTENRGCFTPKRVESCPAIPVAVLSKIRPGHIPVEKIPGTTTYRRKEH